VLIERTEPIGLLINCTKSSFTVYHFRNDIISHDPIIINHNNRE
jgi:hypothetical protein